MMLLISLLAPEEEDVIIFHNVCEIKYYKHGHICVFMLIYLDVLKSFEFDNWSFTAFIALVHINMI